MFYAYFPLTYLIENWVLCRSTYHEFHGLFSLLWELLQAICLLFLFLDFLFLFGMILKNHYVLLVKCSIFLRNW